MRLRNAGKFPERQFKGRETIMDDNSRYDGRGRPGIIRLHRRQFIAATLGHAAALRGEPGGSVLPRMRQARFGGQNPYGHNEKRDRDENNSANSSCKGTAPTGCTSSNSEQVIYPCGHLPLNFTCCDSTPIASGLQRQLQKSTPGRQPPFLVKPNLEIGLPGKKVLMHAANTELNSRAFES